MPADGVSKILATNTRTVENIVQSTINKFEGLNIGRSISKGEVPSAFKQEEFASSNRARYNQTPALSNPTVEFKGTRGESLCMLKPPPDPIIQKILTEAGIGGIQYKNGVPEFSPVAKAQVEIIHMLGGTGGNGAVARRLNFTQADEKLEDDKLIFFEANESALLLIELGQEKNNPIYYDEIKIANSFEEFLRKIMEDDNYYINME